MDWSQLSATSSSFASVSWAVSPLAIQPGNSRISPRNVPSDSGTTTREYGRFKYSAGVILLFSGLAAVRFVFVLIFVFVFNFIVLLVIECLFPPKDILIHQIE